MQPSATRGSQESGPPVLWSPGPEVPAPSPLLPNLKDLSSQYPPFWSLVEVQGPDAWWGFVQT